MRHPDPAISVVMSVYNGEPYLAGAVESILAQDFEDFEFVVIDDGSTDASRDILRSFADERLVLIEQTNQGLPSALNRGIRESRSPLIARMDADDIAMRHRLRWQLEFMERNSEYVAVGSNVSVIDQDGRYVYTTAEPLDDQALRKRLPQTPFYHPASVFRKAAFAAVGGYCEQMVMAQDTVFFNRMMRLGKVANLAEPLIQYRIVPTAITKRERVCPEYWRIVRKAINENRICREDAAYLLDRRKHEAAPERTVAYHTFLAKKLLWNSFRPSEARVHLRKSFRLKRTWEAALLYGASFLPEGIVRHAYQMRKRWG